MDFDDEWLFNDRPTRERFIDVIRGARPDVVLAHSPNDYHPDHRNAGQVAIDARIPAAVRLVETTLPATERIPHSSSWTASVASTSCPRPYVDVTETIELKEQMLLCHESQDSWLRAIFDDMDYVKFMRELTGRRGDECGQAVGRGVPGGEDLPHPRFLGAAARFIRRSDRAGPMTAMPEVTGSAPRAPVARASRRVLAVLRASNWQLNTGVDRDRA